MSSNKSMQFYPPKVYQPTCQNLFNIYRDKVLAVLPTARVEHMGASAVPNCISKGDLDIFVGVEAKGFEEAITVLCTLGFYEKTDTLRTDSLCMLESDNDSHNVALQVVASGTEFECFLRFRDALRAYPEWVEEYNALKLSCVGWQADDYRRKKSEFVEKVLASVQAVD